MAGDVVFDPIRRQRMTFSREAAVLKVDIVVDPGGDVPSHRHPAQEERFQVIEGSGRFRVGGKARQVRPGDGLSVPPGMTHSFKNTGSTSLRLLVEVAPPLRLQEFLDEAARLARERKYTRLGIPRGLHAAAELAALLRSHREEIEMTFPPRVVQRLLLGPLAKLAPRENAP